MASFAKSSLPQHDGAVSPPPVAASFSADPAPPNHVHQDSTPPNPDPARPDPAHPDLAHPDLAHPDLAYKDRVWRVIHACDSIRSVADLVEAQITAGMRPFVLTGETRSRPGSLLETWSDVRGWKKLLEGTDGAAHPLQSSVVHCHAFPPAMAAVRAGLTTVYDAQAFVDDFAVTAGQCTERSWLARSFRTAEEFVLPRAGAVVVHSTLMKAACLKSGVDKQNLFFIPRPMHLPPDPDAGWLRRAFDFADDVVTIFAQPAVAEDETLIRAFALAAAEVPGVRMFVAAPAEQTASLRRFAHQQEVDDGIFFLSPEDEGPALQAADIVIAGWPIFPDDSSWGRIHALTIARSGTALAAMAHGRCLLAADCSAHRDLTPEGRGVLWFGQSESSSTLALPAGAISASKDKASELANRLAFLARNPDFRAALGETARAYLRESRDPERIGRMYREVYRCAELNRTRGDDAHTQMPILIPAQNAV